MRPAWRNVVVGVGWIGLGVALAAAGIYIGEIDDAPGGALLGILLMIGATVLGIRTARRKH